MDMECVAWMILCRDWLYTVDRVDCVDCRDIGRVGELERHDDVDVGSGGSDKCRDDSTEVTN